MKNGKSNRNIKYECARCGREVGKDNLVVKSAVFKEMGANAPQIKSRVAAWLCRIPQTDGSPSCLDLDPHFTAPRMVGTPGHADTRLAGPPANPHPDMGTHTPGDCAYCSEGTGAPFTTATTA